jgi:hypothetical protein
VAAPRRRGLPYAIVEDLAAVPRDARTDMITLQAFGPAAVVKNARPGAAPGSDPESLPCRPQAPARGLTPRGQG